MHSEIVKKFGKGKGILNYVRNKNDELIKINYEIKVNSNVRAVVGEITKTNNKFKWKIFPNKQIDNWSQRRNEGEEYTFVSAFKTLCEKGWK